LQILNRKDTEVAKPGIVVEDYENRCDYIFPDSGERCWLQPCKIVKLPGGKIRGQFCSYHYEVGLAAIAQRMHEVLNGKESDKL
jgi:hypothetical protein